MDNDKIKDYKEPRKKSFLLFYDAVNVILEELEDDARLGRWFRSIAEYEMYGDKPNIKGDDALRFMVKEQLRQLDRNMSSFLERCETNKENRNREKDKAELMEKYKIETWSDDNRLTFKSEMARVNYNRAVNNGELPSWAPGQQEK